MWNKSDREWRVKLWRHMLEMLPVEVLVNLAGRGFSLRDRWNATIYADDIDEAQYGRMLVEWAALMDCGERLWQELNPDALNRRCAAGEQEFHFRLDTNLGELAVRVSFRGKPDEEPFIIRLERKAREEAADSQ